MSVADGGVIVERAVPATVVAATAPLSAEAERAARVMMRKSPQTLRTYQGIYTRFAAWLATRDGVAEPSVTDFTPEAFLAYLDEREPVASPSTVKKERAALRKLARYLHQLRLIDATVILMVEIPTVTDSAPARQGLDRPSWQRVLTVARARLTTSARSRARAAAAARDLAAAAARDLALIQVLVGAGLRSGEARSLPVDPFDQGRSDNHGGSVYLRVHGKGHKIRSVPLYTDVTAALEQWRHAREQIPELAGDPLLFPQLGRGRRDGSFPTPAGSYRPPR
jgi:site-specific recombinase XerD